jgi:hypothetical protein
MFHVTDSTKHAMHMTRYEFQLSANYHQFYIQDEAADGNLSDAWTPDAVERLLALAPGVVGIGTARNTEVPVTIDVMDSEPRREFAMSDHTVECSISISSGTIVVAGCTDYFPDAARIQVQPGSYRVRVNFAELGSVSDDGLEGSDRYHLQLWRATIGDVTVLK